jgi:hypothetical protein
MDLSGAVGDAWEILANIGGNRGHPGSGRMLSRISVVIISGKELTTFLSSFIMASRVLERP